MAHEARTFGTSLNGERRAFAPLNIQNNNRPDGRHLKQLHSSLTNHYPVACLEDQENRLAAIHAKKDALSRNVCDIVRDYQKGPDNSFQIFDDGIFSQETAQQSFHDDDRILDDNIEAVKKELNSFLIDSQEKSQISEIFDKENKSVDDSLMIVDSKDASLSDSVLEQSEISYIQHNCDFDLFADYSESILAYMLGKERKHMPDPFYMNNQANINTKMRSILVDWLVDVADEYNIKDETLFLAINYVDRFLSKISISRQDFQLLGTSALFIATKYEEIYPPEIGEFVYITDDSFSKLQILQMEKLILSVLDFDVSTPTSNYFLEKFLADLELDKEVYCLSKYLCFLSALECAPFLKYYPSEIAICSILIASRALQVADQIPADFISKTLQYERSLDSKGDVFQLLNDRNTLMEELNKLHIFAANHQQQAIQRKYSGSKYYRVGKIVPEIINK